MGIQFPSPYSLPHLLRGVQGGEGYRHGGCALPGTPLPSRMPTLNWIGKDAVVRHHNDVPFRLLEADETLSHGQETGNLIVQGDNLHALKALLNDEAGIRHKRKWKFSKWIMREMYFGEDKGKTCGVRRG